VEVFDRIPLELDAEDVLRSAHLGDAGDDIGAQVRELVAAARHLACPKAVIEVGYVENRSEGAVDIGGIRFTSRILRANLQDVERVFVYVATCGRELDEVPVPAGDFLLDYCRDLIKGQALAAAMRYLGQHLTDRYALGKTSGMNPGSLEDWPITEQIPLFSIFGDVEEVIGVTLTDSCLMIPNKSLSGITYATEASFTSCQLCPRGVCSGRRAPFDPELATTYGVTT
jgi:hypothetical protein